MFFSVNITGKLEENPKSPFSIASLTFAILAFVMMCCYYLAPVFSILAILFGRISKYDGKFDKIGFAGYILGFLSAVCSFSYLAYALYVLSNPELLEQAQQILDNLQQQMTTAPTQPETETGTLFRLLF